MILKVASFLCFYMYSPYFSESQELDLNVRGANYKKITCMMFECGCATLVKNNSFTFIMNMHCGQLEMRSYLALEC
jgi:hypothetical protein